MSVRQPPLLPKAEVPFPVEGQYLIRPDLKRLEPEGQRFVLDEVWPRYLLRKLELLEAHPQQCRVVSGEDEQILASLWQVAGLLATEQPRQCTVDTRGILFPSLGFLVSAAGEVRECGEPFDERLRGRILRHLAPLRPVERLADALALAVQEDLVLMAGPPDEDRAQLLHVCFPSHWNPAARAGASFAQFHEPVPHNERLLAGSGNLVGAMLAKGPFVRFVWSLTRTPRLDQNPARFPDAEAGSLDEHGKAPPNIPLLDSLYFRSERQTTTPLAGQALFTIRIYVAPLRQVLSNARATLLSSAIRSMDDELLRYKSLAKIKEPLLRELDEFAGSS